MVSTDLACLNITKEGSVCTASSSDHNAWVVAGRDKSRTCDSEDACSKDLMQWSVKEHVVSCLGP